MDSGQLLYSDFSLFTSILALFVALLAGSRLFFQIVIYYLYRPYVYVYGQDVYFWNESGRPLSAEIDLVSDLPIKDEISWPFSNKQSTFASGGYKFTSDEVQLPPGIGSSLPAQPFEIEEKGEVDVIIHPYIEASEFGLPGFFGKFKLIGISSLIHISAARIL